MKTITTASFFYATVLVLVLLLALVLFASSQKVGASAPFGVAATVATSSVFTIPNTAGGVLVFATSSCIARIITTGSSTVMLTFSDLQGFTPNGLQGHLQLGSTTVAYDGSIYGCNAVRAFGYQGGTVYVTETR